MLALIHREGRSAMLDVGGRPLIGRQVQWLRSIGCSRIAIELGDDELSGRISEWLSSGEIAAPDLVPILAPAGSHLRDLADRAGFPSHAPFLAVPGDVLGDGDLISLYGRADRRGVTAPLAAPLGIDSALGGAVVRVVGEERGQGRSAIGPGVGVRVRNAYTALALGVALLQRSFGAGLFPVHAEERSPGVFVARGAIVDARAVLYAPVFIGADAWVERDATVGPFAVVGARAVVECGARVERAVVEDGVVVGEGLSLERCLASARGVEDYARAGTSVSLGDPLLLDGREPSPGNSWSARALALLCLPALAPLRALGMSSMPSASHLLEVVRGERPLVGVGGGGAFDVESALIDEDDEELRMRARAWYAHEKRAGLDARLVWASLRRS